MKVDNRYRLFTDNMANAGSDDNARREWTKSGGDVAAQRKLEERMTQLGLLDNKIYFEKVLSERLERRIEQRNADNEPTRNGRRRRPLKDRANSMAQQITNIIRAKVVTDNEGCRVYTVNVLMGEFTRDVRHVVADHVIVLSGSTPVGGGPTLSKDVTIEFPAAVVMDELSVAFAAGVYKLRVPFAKCRRDSLTAHNLLMAAPSTSCGRTLSDDCSWTNCRSVSGSSGYETLSTVSTPSAIVNSDTDDEKVFQISADIVATQKTRDST